MASIIFFFLEPKIFWESRAFFVNDIFRFELPGTLDIFENTSAIFFVTLHPHLEQHLRQR